MAAATLPTNEVVLSLAEVARVTGGELLGTDLTVRGVSTDSRADLTGKLFVALLGERFDGHDFAEKARAAGASALLVEREVETTLPVVKVGSTLAALGALGAHRRRRWAGKLVAVAGSAGKTTTRAAISALLEAAEPAAVHYARGNFNNLIGVPLVLLSLGDGERLAVAELGTNQPGEVATLTRMAAPDAAVLTLIGYEHTEGLGNLDGVEAEEGALFAHLAPEGLALGNVDDERVRRQLARAPGRRIGYGQRVDAEYRFRVLSLSERGSEIEATRTRDGRGVSTRFRTNTLGDAGAYAAVAALAAAEAVLGREISAEILNRAFASAVASEAGRLCPIELTGGILLLDDTYNSNPESVESSLKTARALADQRGAELVLVLGEMRELGELSPSLHEKVGVAAAAQRPALLLAVSGDARHLCDAAQRAGASSEFVGDAPAAAELLVARLSAPAVVLVKASRGVRAERIVERLVQAKGRAA